MPNDVLPLPAGDLDGDGADDVVIWAFDLDSTPGRCDAACPPVSTYTYHWTVEVLSGDDGSRLWRRVTPGELDEGGTGAFSGLGGEAGEIYGGAYSGLYHATNFIVLPLLGSDHDGDGTQDLVIDSLELHGIYFVGWAELYPVLWSAGGTDSGVFSTRAEIVSGRSGEPLFTR